MKKIKNLFSKLSINAEKYPDWKDICRKELLEDFNLNTVNENELNLLKKRFNLLKMIYWENFWTSGSNLKFLFYRLYILLIVHLIMYCSTFFNSYFSESKILIASYSLVFSILFVRLLYKLPYKFFNWSQRDGGNGVEYDIPKIKRLSELQLKLYQKLHISFANRFIQIFTILVVDFLSVFAIVYWFDILNEELLYTIFYTFLIFFPTMVKLNHLFFSFKSLMRNKSYVG